MSSKSRQSVQLKAVMSVAVTVAAEPIVRVLSPKVRTGSVVPLLKVQAKDEPDPQVVAAISVLLKVTVRISPAEGVVSIPVPAAIVKVSPFEMV